MVRSDKGGENDSTTFAEYCALNGIVHQTTALYIPQQNGIVKIKNRTIKEMANAMLNSLEVPHNL